MLEKILSDLKCETVIIDFDHTITMYKSHTSIGVFSELLDISSKEKKEINGKADNSKNSLYMKYHWKKKIKLLEKYNATSLLEEASNLFYINEKIKVFLDNCYKKKIRIIILSSGYKPLIEYLLNKYEIKYDELYASDGKKIITPLNKKKILKKALNNAIIIGDNIQDYKMYKNAVFKIGICHDILEYEKMKKYFDYVKLENIEIIARLKTSKSNVGVFKNNGKKYFYKEKNDNNIKEMEGYNEIKDYYKTSKTCIETEEYIVYEYIKDFFTSSLNDYLYGTEERIILPFITNSYKKAMRNSLVLIDESATKSSKFFSGRLTLLEETLNNLEYETVIFNEKPYDIKTILKETIKNIKKEKRLHAFLTNGDPTDTNITTTGYFTDFENAGYNLVISEIAIMFISLFTHGSYFYPKYNQSAYEINNVSLKVYNDYKLNVKYKINKDVLYVSSLELKINKKNKEVILELLEMYKSSPYFENYKNDFKYLKHYIIMRLLTPITIDKMSNYDKVVILSLIIVINERINDLESLIKLLNSMEVYNANI